MTATVPTTTAVPRKAKHGNGADSGTVPDTRAPEFNERDLAFRKTSREIGEGSAADHRPPLYTLDEMLANLVFVLGMK